jgi:hypothetical protein
VSSTSRRASSGRQVTRRSRPALRRVPAHGFGGQQAFGKQRPGSPPPREDIGTVKVTSIAWGPGCWWTVRSTGCTPRGPLYLKPGATPSKLGSRGHPHRVGGRPGRSGNHHRARVRGADDEERPSAAGQRRPPPHRRPPRPRPSATQKRKQPAKEQPEEDAERGSARSSNLVRAQAAAVVWGGRARWGRGQGSGSSSLP